MRKIKFYFILLLILSSNLDIAKNQCKELNGNLHIKYWHCGITCANSPYSYACDLNEKDEFNFPITLYSKEIR